MEKVAPSKQEGFGLLAEDMAIGWHKQIGHIAGGEIGGDGYKRCSDGTILRQKPPVESNANDASKYIAEEDPLLQMLYNN